MIETLAKAPPKKPARAAARDPKNGPGTQRRAGSGIVSFCIYGPASKATFPPSKLVELLRAGLPVRELNDLQAALDVPLERLVPLLGISKATFHRRQAAGRLDPAESDRVIRFARLMGRAVVVLESEANARRWLTSPQFGLGGAVPLDYAETEVGAREVEDLLGRIEYGVYS
jgi:putative toxin-antitoxin system antitoxin component (TIGR02293 family)